MFWSGFLIASSPSLIYYENQDIIKIFSKVKKKKHFDFHFSIDLIRLNLEFKIIPTHMSIAPFWSQPLNRITSQINNFIYGGGQDK